MIVACALHLGVLQHRHGTRIRPVKDGLPLLAGLLPEAPREQFTHIRPRATVGPVEPFARHDLAVREPQTLQQRVEELRLQRPDGHVPAWVLALVAAVVRRAAVEGVCAALAAPHALLGQQARERAEVAHAVDHVGLDDLPPPARRPADQGEQHARERRVAAAREVREDVARRRRRRAPGAQHAQHPRGRNVVDVVARHGRVLAVAAEAGQAHDDEPGVRAQEDTGRVEAQFLEDAGPEGVDEDVGVRDQGEEDGARRRVLEVECDGGFVGREQVGRRWTGAVDAQD